MNNSILSYQECDLPSARPSTHQTGPPRSQLTLPTRQSVLDGSQAPPDVPDEDFLYRTLSIKVANKGAQKAKPIQAPSPNHPPWLFPEPQKSAPPNKAQSKIKLISKTTRPEHKRFSGRVVGTAIKMPLGMPEPHMRGPGSAPIPASCKRAPREAMAGDGSSTGALPLVWEIRVQLQAPGFSRGGHTEKK